MHKSNAAMRYYRWARTGAFVAPTEPDILSDQKWSIPMNILIRAAFFALSIATIAPVANAATFHNGSTVAGDAVATQVQQSGTMSR